MRCGTLIYFNLEAANQAKVDAIMQQYYADKAAAEALAKKIKADFFKLPRATREAGKEGYVLKAEYTKALSAKEELKLNKKIAVAQIRLADQIAKRDSAVKDYLSR